MSPCGGNSRTWLCWSHSILLSPGTRWKHPRPFTPQWVGNTNRMIPAGNHLWKKGIKAFSWLLLPAPSRRGWGPGTVTRYQGDKEPLDNSSAFYYSQYRAGSRSPLGKPPRLQERHWETSASTRNVPFLKTSSTPAGVQELPPASSDLREKHAQKRSFFERSDAKRGRSPDCNRNNKIKVLAKKRDSQHRIIGWFGLERT